MVFLGQIYCPNYENEKSFHRTMFIFACIGKQCRDNPGAVTVWRSQLPLKNKYYGEHPPNYTLLDKTHDEISQEKIYDELEEFKPQIYSFQMVAKKQLEFVVELYPEEEKVTKYYTKRLALLQKLDPKELVNIDELEEDDSDDGEETKEGKGKGTGKDVEFDMDENWKEDDEEEEVISKAEKEYSEQLLKKYIDEERENAAYNGLTEDEAQSISKAEDNMLDQIAGSKEDSGLNDPHQ